MQIMFTDEERSWMETKKFGMPIKSGCPQSIRESIEEKKDKIKSQDIFRKDQRRK